MRTITRFVAATLAAIGLSAFAWADIQVDNVSALSGLGVNGGTYSFVQFRLDDQRFTVTGAEALGDVVWVKSIGVVQRPGSGNTIAASSTLRIQQSTAENASGISSTQNEAVIAISQPLSASSTETLTVGTASQALRTYTFAAPFPLKKSTLYTAKFYNASGNSISPQLAMYNGSTTQNKNTSIHASGDSTYSPCVRIIAVERSKLAEVGASANWSELWGDATPAETDTVGLNVTAANAALTMDASATVAGLAIGSETAVGPLTLTGTGSLSSTTTTIATDTDVSAITASLGRVSIGSGKTLTVRTLEQVASLSATNGTLATTGDTALAAESTLLSSVSNLIVRGGTFSSSLSGQSALATGRNITVTGSGSNLLLAVGDGTGWGSAGPGIRVEKGGTLTFASRDTLMTPITLCGGTMTFSEDAAGTSGRALDFYNGNGNVVKVEATETGSVEVPTTSSITVAGTENNAKLAIRNGTLTFNVEERAKLVVSGSLISRYNDNGTPKAVTKAGDGVLELTAENTFDTGLTISGGRVLVTGNGTLGTGTVTVNEGKTLEVQVANAATKTIANTLSGAGTVKKSGEGTLSLTGTMSGFTGSVEVAEGTLAIGTVRPTVNALATGAKLKLTATAAELTTQTIRLTVGGEVTSVTADQVAVVTVDDKKIAVNSVSLENRTLTLTLDNVLPKLTVKDNERTWTNNNNSNAWPTSGTVIIDATELTTAAVVALPASAAFGELIVLGSSAKTTLTVGAETTIMKLSPSGYVAMAVDAVNAITDTNPVTIAAGGIFEVVAESDAMLTKAITGAGKFAKGGSGVLTLGANITTTGGSIVQSGELKFSSNGYINATSASYTDATGDVLVKSGATLNLAGRGSSGGLLLREVTLEENAIFKNETTNIETNQRQLQKLTLLGDAIVVADKDFGLLASGHGETTLTLNGHTLTKQGDRNFWLMNARVNGGASGGKIVVEAGSITNTVANKPVTFSTPITLESTLTGTPFNLTGADVTASDNLTANGPVAFAKLITASGKTIAGTGTVTVTEMSLGGALNVTGNLVIDRTGQTDTRTFNNAIKVAAAGSLTTKGNITWGSDSNEFLGSLTVASGTLSIKTPDQKLGGNITIASDAILKIAKTVTTTTTGVITGGGKLVIGDGTAASSVTLNGTLGTVTGTGESAQATCALALEVAAASELCLTPNVATTLTSAITGAGDVVIGDGTAASTVKLTEACSYTGTTTIAKNAILLLGSGADNLSASATAKVVVNGLLQAAAAEVSYYRPTEGSGVIYVPSSTTLVIGQMSGAVAEDGTGKTGLTGFTGTLKIAGTFEPRNWCTNSNPDYIYTVTGCDVVFEGAWAEIKTTQGGAALVEIAAGKKVSGGATMSVPLAFQAEAMIETRDIGIRLDGVALTMPQGDRERVLVKATTAKGSSGFLTVSTEYAPADMSGFDFAEGSVLTKENACLNRALSPWDSGATACLQVLPKPTLSTSAAGVADAILAQTIANPLPGNVPQPIASVKVADKARMVLEGALFFENVVETVYEPQGDGDQSTYGYTAKVTYDFGVSAITVKRLTLADTPELCVVVCAKVESTAVSGTAATFKKSAQVQLYLNDKLCDGTEGNGPAATTLTDVQLRALGITPAAGEKWFAVPMAKLNSGTNAFTVKVTK